MLSRGIVGGILVPAAAVAGGLISAPGENPRLDPAWTVSLQGGYANTFQLMLGGTFGHGPDIQNRLTASISNLVRSGDSLTFFGWSTTDAASLTPNWQAGAGYKSRILHKRHQTILIGGGVQRWLFPNVKTGANDWLATGTLTYATLVKHVPVTVTEDSYSLLVSTLPTGSLLYTQIQAQHSLLKHEHYQLSLRHGPAHTYGWGFYGAAGNRVVRYGAAVALTWNDTTIELGCRQQFGLQDRVPYNRFWNFLVTRQMSGRFHSKRGQ